MSLITQKDLASKSRDELCGLLAKAFRAANAGYIEAPNWGVSLRVARHDGLVLLETFERIQERLKEGAKAPTRTHVGDDFPLRGFVSCADCGGPLTSSWSKSKTGKKHPYYMCFTKGCESYRKSIRKDQIEGEFEELLAGVRPTRSLFELARAMFTDAWEQHRAQSAALTRTLEQKLVEIERDVSKPARHYRQRIPCERHRCV